MEEKSFWTALADPLLAIGLKLADYLPNLIGALALFLGGWLLARLLRGLTARFIDGSFPLIQKLSRRSTESTGVLQRRIRVLFVNLVFWTVLLVFTGAALEVLEIDLFSLWLSNAVAYLPNLIAGVLIVFAGFILGGMAQQLVAQAADTLELGSANVLGRTAQVIAILLGLVIGINQVGIDVSLLSNVITVLLLTSLGGLAITIALSSRQQVSNYLAANYVRKLYQVDDRVKIDQQEGRILEIGDWCVLLETSDGDLSVPASRFLESNCLKLAGEVDREKS